MKYREHVWVASLLVACGGALPATGLPPPEYEEVRPEPWPPNTPASALANPAGAGAASAAGASGTAGSASSGGGNAAGSPSE